MNESRKWRWGVNRWFVLLFVILGAVAAGAYKPILPHIQLPAEAYSQTPLFTLPLIGDFYWTNTLTAMVLADIILILLALAVRRALSGGDLIPRGLSGAMEALLELIYNLTESTAGKWTRQIFPFFATITLLVLVVNWMELIPMVDSVGILEHSAHGYPVQEIIPGVVTLD